MEGVALYSYRRLSAANKEDGRGVRAGNEIAKHFAGNNVDVIIDDFSAPEPEREAWPTGPGLSFPGQPAG